MLGYPISEMMGQHIFSFMDDYDVEKYKNKLVGRQFGTSENYEFELQRKDGTRISTLISTSPLFDGKGDYTGAIAGIVDISERKKAENALKAAKTEAERANKAKSTFLTNVGHELRTPLNGIISCAELLSGNESKEELLNLTQIIKSSSCSLLNSIEQILEYTKTQDGELVIDKQPFKLSQALKGMKTNFIIKGINIELIPQIMLDGEAIPDDVIGDPKNLISILNPILENAAKFTNGKPEAILKIKLLEKTEKNAVVQFSVSDKGVGISENNIRTPDLLTNSF